MGRLALGWVGAWLEVGQRGGSMATRQQISLVEKRKNEEARPSESEERVDNGNNEKEEKKEKRKKII